MTKSQASHRINIAVLFLPVFLGFVGGLDFVSSIKLGLLVALCGAPGVLLVGWMFPRTRVGIDTVGLGIPLGILLALLSQQVGIALHLGTLGWIVPIAVSIPFCVRSLIQRGHNFQFSGQQRFIASTGSALFVLADVHWAFLFAALVAVFALAANSRRGILLLSGGLLGVKFLLPDFWYLISDDRWFEEAYSRSIHLFGFWDWYGSSETWVPYHWLGHALGGLAQSFVSDQIFVAVGIVPSIVTAVVFSSAVASLFSTLGGDSRWTSWCTLLCPIFGVFARGESNSADLSIAFGVWLIALILLVLQERRALPVSHFVVSIASASLLLIKVSTGIVVIAGILLTVMHFGHAHKMLRHFLGLCVSIAALASLTLVLNFDFVGIANNDDSRSRIVLKLGGFLSLDGASIAIKLLVVGFTAFSGLLLPLLMILGIRNRRSLESQIAILVLAMLGIGWILRLLVVSYNNESYLEVAILCASPLLVGIVFRESLSEKLRRMFAWSMILGASVGYLQVLMISRQGSTRIDAAIRLLGNSPILLLPVLLLALGTWLRNRGVRWRHLIEKKVVLLFAVSLLGAQVGPDVFRIVDHLRFGRVWAETNFGGDDSYFFGTLDDQRAGSWLRRNALKSDLIGTNRICEPFTGCSGGGQTPIAAWSGLRSYLEAERFITGRQIDELLPGEKDARGYPEWLTDRQELLFDFGRSQSSSLRNVLKGEGLTWYWLDLRVKGARLAPNQDVAYRSGPIVVIRL